MGAPAFSDLDGRDDAIVHGSCVALTGKGLLITGRSGSGKSALCLQMVALGAELVADDRVQLRREEGQILARAPAAIAGLIEARGIGISTNPKRRACPSGGRFACLGNLFPCFARSKHHISPHP